MYNYVSVFLYHSYVSSFRKQSGCDVPRDMLTHKPVQSVQQSQLASDDDVETLVSNWEPVNPGTIS